LSNVVKIYVIVCIIFAISGLSLFFAVSWPPSENAPKGPLEIGVGPQLDARTNKTELYIDVPSNSIDVCVTFRFNEIKQYFIYVIFPYAIKDATAYAIHNYGRYPNPNLGDIGNFSLNSMNTPYGSSILNATLALNSNFPYFHFTGPDLTDELTLAVSVKFSDSLIAISYPWRTSQTVILTFFGDVSGIITDDMYAFKRPSSQLTIDYPFIIHLRMPSSSYFSESQPSPIQYYVKEGRRWAMFSLDFLEGHYAQTLFCTFINPTTQDWKQISIFVGGVFVAISTSLVIQIMRYYFGLQKITSTDKTEKEVSGDVHKEGGPSL